MKTANRWQMNRIGFVNFWLYDDQDFHFADGKLLLRGANGSGKSITTQSFIPFILDGNTRPERFDPFGSRDRRLDYYLIGVQERDEATSYLYLEFKKEGSELYRTIGIGLRAQKGKNISFWGFCLKDGRRIGYDFFLYKEIGTTKLPLTKVELKKEIEEDCFAENNRTYMEIVNRYLFGFQQIEQYDQFIRLLIKVRSPKLSKEFAPSKVYEILNSSLQTLSGEDLRAMVDAMEKMDEIYSRLESYKEGFKDAGIIKVEYDRYNQYMLGKKAAFYQEKKETAKNAAKLSEQLNQEIEQLNETVKTDHWQLTEYRNERTQLHLQKNALQDVNLVRAAQSHQQLQEEIADTRNELAGVEVQLEGIIELREEKYRQLRHEETQFEERKKELSDLLKELNEIQKTLQLDGHKAYVQEVVNLPGKQYHQSFQDQVVYIKKQIQDSIQALKQQEDAEVEYSLKEEEWQSATVETEQAFSQVERSRRMEDDERDRLIEAFYIYEKNCTLLGLDPVTLQHITKIVQHYQGMTEDKELTELLNQQLTLLHRPMEEEQLRLRHTISLHQKEYEAAKRELDLLRAMKEPVPSRKITTVACREALAAAGIPFCSFYEVVDFADGISAAQAALLEDQLADSGILDALVVTSDYYNQAIQVLGNQSDQILRYSLDEENHPEFPLLKPAGISSAFDKAAKAILRMITTEEEDHTCLTLNTDGTYYHGLIRGHSMTSQETGYIGVAARAQKRLDMIATQEQVVAQWEQRIEQTRQELTGMNEQIELLLEEFRHLPQTQDLIQALAIVMECENTYQQFKNISDRLEKEKIRLHEILHQKRQVVLLATKGLPYPRKLDQYEEVWEAIDRYERLLGELERLEAEIIHARTLVRWSKDEIDRLEEQTDKSYLRIEQIRVRLEKKVQEIAAVEEVLNKPKNKELARKLMQMEERLKVLQDSIEQLSGSVSAMTERMANKSAELEQLSHQQEELAAALRIAYQCYEEELHLGYVIALEHRSPDEVLKEALACIRETDRIRNTDEMFNSLNRNYSQHSSHLTAYQPKIEECFESIPNFISKRYNIRFTWNGQQLSLYEFHKLLRSTIEETQLLIQEEDRKLFEDILADTLVQKLNYRIMESRRWIRNMSYLMSEMDTSMGMNFALDWRGKTKSDEQELDTAELEKLFSRDRALLTNEDREKVSKHFRMQIQSAKRIVEENGQTVNYADLVQDALDYRQWFEFRMYYKRKGKEKKELTNTAFNQFSGGEKAMSMYVPLFAAVSAQYQMAEESSPYIVALDEAFAGVDEKNIGTMFELVETLKFGYIMNSQALWGCYETVKSLSICELLPSEERDMVTVIPYHWNGIKRTVFKKIS